MTSPGPDPAPATAAGPAPVDGRPAVHHPVFARFWTRVGAPALRREGADPLRARLLEGLAGDVVEVGAGEGSNFGLYPGTVRRVLAVEPEAYLRQEAEQRARELADRADRAGPEITVVDGLAARLPVADGTVDAVVFCLVLCGLDPAPALAEATRVLRPGGEVRFLEHVEDPRPGARRRVQRLLDATVWPHLVGGCHLGRDTVGAVEAGGLEVVRLERLLLPEGSRGPAAPTVLGRAVVPDRPG